MISVIDLSLSFQGQKLFDDVIECRDTPQNITMDDIRNLLY